MMHNESIPIIFYMHSVSFIAYNKNSFEETVLAVYGLRAGNVKVFAALLPQ